MIQVAHLVAGNKVSLTFRDEVGGADWVGSETQMRDSYSAGFLRVILKVTLSVVGGLVTNDLDRVLVGTNGTIRTKTKEDRLDDILWQNLKGRVVINAEIGDIVHDANSKSFLGLILGKFVKDTLDHCRGEILGRKAIPSATEQGHLLAGRSAIQNTSCQGINNILEERFANGTRFLGAVEHCDFLDGRGDDAQEVFDREGAIEAHNHHTHFFAVSVEVFGDFCGSFRAGAHNHDHTVRVRCAMIFHDLVFATGKVSKAFHFFFHDPNALVIIAVDRLASLEVHVGILGSTADHGRVRSQGAFSMRDDHVFINEGAQIVVGEAFDFINLVRGAEAIKEVHEWDTGSQGCSCGNRSSILGFLCRVGGNQTPTSLAYSHHILVVAKNGKCLGSQ